MDAWALLPAQRMGSGGDASNGVFCGCVCLVGGHTHACVHTRVPRASPPPTRLARACEERGRQVQAPKIPLALPRRGWGGW